MEVVNIDTNEKIVPVEQDKEERHQTGNDTVSHSFGQKGAAQNQYDFGQADSGQNKDYEKKTGYKIIKYIKTAMDDWYLDPLLGLLPSGWGDIVTAVCTIPFIVVALFSVRSIPLTIAILYNSLVDILVGLIPFFVGDVMDVFSKSYKKNFDLIIGYVEGDKKIRREVRKKTVISSVIIVVLCVAIYFMLKWTIMLGAWLWGLVAS